MSAGPLTWLAVHAAAPDSLLAVLAVLASLGHDPEAAKQAAKLPPNFEVTRPRVSFLAATELWRYAIAVSGDPAFGLRVADEYLRRDRGLVSYLVRTSPSIAEGLAHTARFAPIEDELCRASWIETETTSTFRFGGSAAFYYPRAAEFLAARLVGAARKLSTTEVSPLLVRFKHDAPPSTSAHSKLFRSRMEFGAESLEVIFPSRVLRQPPHASEPPLHDLLLAYAEQALADVTRPRGISERIRELVMRVWQQEHGRLPIRSEVAKMLRVTPRTLSRWLEAEGKTYSDVIDEFRAVTAMHTLQKPDSSLSDLAQQLGFRDQSAFTHAFRRWTGMTPGQYRRAHANVGR